MNHSVNSLLVETVTSDTLILHAYYIPADSKTAVLHIHGFEGNFYENHFVHVLADTFSSNKIPFLAVNTRGNNTTTYINTTDGKEVTIGAHLELLHEAYRDIDAWIEFLLDKGYEDIVLCGHSLGTIKAVRYLFEGTHIDRVKKLILLAPFDKTSWINKKSHGHWQEYLKIAQEKVAEGKGEERIPADWDASPYSYQTYVSWNEDTELSKMFDFYNKNYHFPVLKKITVPTKIVVGSIDPAFHPSNSDNPQEAMDVLLKNIPNSQGKLIKGAVHSFAPHEQIMAEAVSDFVRDG